MEETRTASACFKNKNPTMAPRTQQAATTKILETKRPNGIGNVARRQGGQAGSLRKLTMALKFNLQGQHIFEATK
jgi:hypothetical protein